VATPETLQVAGLQLANNDFTASPPGSLALADNVVIDAKGVAQPRNGQMWLATLNAVLDLPFALGELQSNLISQYGLSKTDTSQGLGYQNAGAVTSYAGGPYNPVGCDGVSTSYMRMKFCLASLFLHFCCASGPKCLETYNGSPRAAGSPPALGGFAQINSTNGTPTAFLPYNSSVAYRVTIKRTSSVSGVPRIGATSDRILATNRIIIPKGAAVRSGTLVTVTLPVSESLLAIPGLSSGDQFLLTGGDPAIIDGAYTVVSGTGGATPAVFTFNTVASGAATSTVQQEANPSISGVSAPVSTTVNALVPFSCVAGDVMQFWRSVATTDSSIEPLDDLYLCGEHTITSGEVSAGVVHFSDNTPEAVLNTPLYTNPSDGDGLGELGSNLPPPIYGDVCNFDSQTWYTNTVGQQFMELELLGCGGPGGVQDGDTFTISDGASVNKTITFKTSPSGLSQTYAVTDGTPSQNIAATAQAFVALFNLNLRTLGVQAYVTSGATDVPGKILIERADFGPQFNVKVSRPTSWSPALDPTTPTYSTNNAQANGLWNSKLQEPEAVPESNFRSIGVPNFYARRLFGLRNALIILKEGDGIWSLTGTGGNYTLTQISSANTIAPDCACIFADCVWAYTDQGILRITESGGAVVVSRPIETDLNRKLADFPNETYAWSFAVPYETERRVMFFVPFGPGTGQGGSPMLNAYCYSLATNAWTGPLYINNATITSGLVPTNKLLNLGIFDTLSAQGRLTIERKGTPPTPFFGLADPPDYLRVADAQRPINITAVVTGTGSSGDVLTLSSIGGIGVGSGLTQGSVAGFSLVMSKVVALRSDISPTSVQVADQAAGFTVAAALVFDPYTVLPQFLPQGGDPAVRKALTRITTIFKLGSFVNQQAAITVSTDQVQDELDIKAPFNGFGLNPFGVGPFGDPPPMVVDTTPNDPKWVNAGQFRVGLRLNEVWATMRLQGMALKLDSADGPVGRGGKPS
jgi:hypothetical protein